ncbi:MAG: 23S rRNA (cytosine(2499)-C(5))-methyltransferase [Phototrophicaceae bacterium]
MSILEQLPSASKRNIAIHVKPAAERALREEHPWVYENSIKEQSITGKSGDIAVIFDKRDRFLAVGLYDADSAIRIKVLHHNSPARVNREFFQKKLADAMTLRQAILETDTTGYRLVYGEGDGLPGLIIDRYADVLVLKLYTGAWFPHLQTIIDCLNELMPDKTLILRMSRLVQDNKTYGLEDGMVIQGNLAQNTVQFRENGLNFQADVIDGHKTGFFFDQRDNRLRVRHLAEGKTVLDVFSYNGGFSVNAAKGGAKSILSLDISAPALASAQANMSLNQDDDNINKCQHDILVADAFEGLKQLSFKRQKFDLVIVDPPTFASSQQQIEGAKQAYQNLVWLALDVLAPKGTLVMASCSSRIPASEFFDIVHTTAIRTGRPLKEIERSQHALDHPIRFREGAYLKCLFAKA